MLVIQKIQIKGYTFEAAESVARIIVIELESQP